MSTDPRKRQKQLERRAAKRKAKHHQIVRATSGGLAQRMAAAASWPILDSFASLDLWDKGIGWVCLSRQLPGGAVAFGVFLIDRYCLGVKNAMADIASRYDYEA